jgi:hypothetical protein
MVDPDSMRAVHAAFAKQIDWCERLGSPFTANILKLALTDMEAGGMTTELTRRWPGDPVADALPLRMAGALHALVLTSAEPELAALYPPNPAEPERLRTALRGVLQRQSAFMATFLKSPPQTNEVGRSAVLIGGFLMIARETGLPLRLLEIGASAGLNTIWDRYQYQLGEAQWGDPRSAVRLAPRWTGPPPPVDAALRVAERAACDMAPVDLADDAQRLRLRAFVWADQQERLARIDAAIGLARRDWPRVEQADAADWIEARLARREGCVTVIYHSIMWQYMPEPTRDSIAASIARAGAAADAAAPLAWLRFEPTSPEETPELRLTLWPDGRDRRLAVAQPHGASVAWSGG